MSQQNALSKMYKIPKKVVSVSKEENKTSSVAPLLKAALATPQRKVLKPETDKVRKGHKRTAHGPEEKNHELSRHDKTKKRRHAYHQRARDTTSRDPIELLDNIWKEMEYDDRRKRNKVEEPESTTPVGSPSYQHATTPMPNTTETKLTRYELLNAPKDDTILDCLMKKVGLMERILAYKIKQGKVDVYRTMRIHGKLDECVRVDDEDVDYGVPDFVSSVGRHGPQTPPGAGPQTPPGSPSAECGPEEHHRAKSVQSSRAEDETVLAETGGPAAKLDNCNTASSSGNGEPTFILPPPPPPPAALLPAKAPNTADTNSQPQRLFPNMLPPTNTPRPLHNPHRRRYPPRAAIPAPSPRGDGPFNNIVPDGLQHSIRLSTRDFPVRPPKPAVWSTPKPLNQCKFAMPSYVPPAQPAPPKAVLSPQGPPPFANQPGTCGPTPPAPPQVQLRFPNPPPARPLAGLQPAHPLNFQRPPPPLGLRPHGPFPFSSPPVFRPPPGFVPFPDSGTPRFCVFPHNPSAMDRK